MMKAMIFAAGMGTRLKPLTDSMPKALVKVEGEPLLWHVLMRLHKAGFDDFVINVHHFSDQVISYLKENGNFGLNVAISDESDLLRDTGGGIRHARKLLEGGDRFLIHNVDIFSNLDIPAFVSEARHNSLSTVLVSKRETQRYFLFDSEMMLKGWTNIATGQAKSPYPSLNPSDCRKFAFAGIHLVSTKVFDAFNVIDSNPSQFPLYDETGKVIDTSLTPLGDKFSIVDFYLRAAAAYPIFGSAPEGLRLVDVGKAASLEQVRSEGFV